MRNSAVLVRLAVAVVVPLMMMTPAAYAERQRVARLDTRDYFTQIALAGPGVVYTSEDADHSLGLHLATPSADRLLRKLGTVPTQPDDEETFRFIQVTLAASPDRLGVRTVTGSSIKANPSYGSETFDWGPVAGTPTSIDDSCGYADDGSPFAVDGGRIAYQANCGYQVETHVRVRDTAGNLVADVPVGADNVIRVRLAGRFLAWWRYDNGATKYGTIVVHDLESGKDVYTEPGANGDFDLQDDGKIVRLSTINAAGDVVSSGPDGCYTLDWFDPSDPGTAHRLPGCVFGAPHIAGDRIAYIARDGSTGVAAVATLDGNVRPIASPADFVDFDGTRFAYTTPACTGAADIYLDDGAGPETSESPACPVEIGSEPLKDGKLKPRVSCPDGCAGNIYVALRRRDGTYKEVTNEWAFAIASGGTRHVLIKSLTKRSILRTGKKRQRAYVVAVVFNRAHARETYRQAVTVVRRR
jgi:hypothetical protein